MATLEDAIEIAAQAHAGQVDKAGSPYILHPLRVMFRVEGVRERIAAVLHDIVEDTPMGFEELRLLGFPEEVLQAVCALTKKPGGTRMMAAKRAAMDPLARAVKIADVTDNMNLSRIEQPTEHDLERQEEYKKVLALLMFREEPQETERMCNTAGILWVKR